MYLLLALIFAGCSVICTIAERKSRKWYQDRIMLRLSGFFAAMACVGVGFWVYELL